MKTLDCFVSVIAPLYNDGEILEDFIVETINVLKNNYSNYELVLVDSGSTDLTSSIVDSLLKRVECIRYIRLSQHYSKEIAISAGLNTVIGDIIVTMSPNTDDPNLIPKIATNARLGSGVVYGVRKSRRGQGLLIRTGASFFHWYCKNFLELRLPVNATSFIALNRQALNAVTKINDQHGFLRLMASSTGFKSQEFKYDLMNRSGKKQRRRFTEEIRLALDIIFSNSIHPLKLASRIGLLASVLSMSYMIYILAVRILKDQIVEGWTTLSLQLSGLFFFLFLILAILAEYIGKISESVKKHPLYHIIDEKNSSVLVANEERRNIVMDSSDK